MNLHEYQAKSIFKEYGLPVPLGMACKSVADVGEAFSTMPNGKCVVKCQAHAGGRGKAGGVKVVTSAMDAESFASNWLGKRIVTFQTGPKGQPVSCILVEACSDIARELYVGATIDRSRSRIVFMASTEGGMEIEKVAQETPEKIFKVEIDPISGAQPFQARALAFKLGLNADQIKQFTKIFLSMNKMFIEKDLSLLEVNPLVVTNEGNIVCLDAKINIDSNALYRHKDLASMADPSQEDPREARAEAVNLNYVALDGNIGCMVNGAGLAMGTMDIIKTFGGNPALTETSLFLPNNIPLVTVQEYVLIYNGAPTANTVSPTLASLLLPISAIVKSLSVFKDKTAISEYASLPTTVTFSSVLSVNTTF